MSGQGSSGLEGEACRTAPSYVFAETLQGRHHGDDARAPGRSPSDGPKIRRAFHSISSGTRSTRGSLVIRPMLSDARTRPDHRGRTFRAGGPALLVTVGAGGEDEVVIGGASYFVAARLRRRGAPAPELAIFTVEEGLPEPWDRQPADASYPLPSPGRRAWIGARGRRAFPQSSHAERLPALLALPMAGAAGGRCDPCNPPHFCCRRAEQSSAPRRSRQIGCQ